jgi:hypothetical protein
VAERALLLFGLVSSTALIAFGLTRALARSYRDRSGVRQGRAAVRAGLLVAFIGACELALTVLLYLTSR